MNVLFLSLIELHISLTLDIYIRSSDKVMQEMTKVISQLVLVEEPQMTQH